MGQGVDDRRAGERAAVAAERVVALLVRRDEQDAAAHGQAPSKSALARSSPSAAAPATTSAMTAGVASTP